MLQDKAFLFRGLLDIDRDHRDSRNPGRKVQHDGDVVVEQNRRKMIPTSEPNLIMEKGCRALDHRAELRIAVCAVELSVIVVVDQKWSIDQVPIVDAGLEEVRERTPRQRQ